MLLIGTRKGAWLLTPDADRTSWTPTGPIFLGHIIQHVVLDPRDHRTLLVASRTGHLGPTVFRSDDLGATWEEASAPPAFAAGDALERSVQSVVLAHARATPTSRASGTRAARRKACSAPRTAATPGSRSTGWNDHPMWADVGRVARGGHARRLDAALGHRRPARPDAPLHRAVRRRRVREHRRRQATGRRSTPARWPTSSPIPNPEFGHDPHCVRLHPLRPDRLYQQNHCGIYRMERPEGRWERIGDNMPRDVGDIGFPIELHPRDPDTAWVFPMDGTDVWPRTSPDGKPGGVRHPRRRRRRGRVSDNGLPDHGVVHGEAPGDDRSTRTIRSACTSARRAARCGRAPTRASRGAPIAEHLPEIYSVEYADAR